MTKKKEIEETVVEETVVQETATEETVVAQDPGHKTRAFRN
jgi:hypothetical protein